MTKDTADTIVDEMMDAAQEASRGCTPVPVTVHSDQPPGADHVMDDGLFGWAWLSIKPVEHPFAKHLRRSGVADPGSAREVIVRFWLSRSRDRNLAAAFAARRVVKAHCPELRCTVATRLD